MILADHEIANHPFMITPFLQYLDKRGISSGLSSHGYDLTLGDKFAVYVGEPHEVLDPLAVTEADVRRYSGLVSFTLAPGAAVLAYAVERISLPRDVVGVVCDKSTYARCFVTVQNTVLEAGWSGEVTLEITNHNRRPVLLRAGQGIAQVLFLRGSPCAVSYADRGGKYQGQAGVTLPRAVS